MKRISFSDEPFVQLGFPLFEPSLKHRSNRLFQDKIKSTFEPEFTSDSYPIMTCVTWKIFN